MSVSFHLLLARPLALILGLDSALYSSPVPKVYIVNIYNSIIYPCSIISVIYNNNTHCREIMQQADFPVAGKQPTVDEQIDWSLCFICQCYKLREELVCPADSKRKNI